MFLHGVPDLTGEINTRTKQKVYLSKCIKMVYFIDIPIFIFAATQPTKTCTTR